MINSGMTTLEEIAYNQLMPWLSSEAENLRYREILRLFDYPGMQNCTKFFAALTNAYSTLKLPLGSELQQEWQIFGGLESNRKGNKIADMLTKYRQSCPKVMFYLLLTGNLISSCILYIDQTLIKYPGNSFRIYFLNRIIKKIKYSLGVRAINATVGENDLLILKIHKLSLVAIYLELLRKYRPHIPTVFNQIEPKEIVEILAGVKLFDRVLGKIAAMLLQLYPEFQHAPKPMIQQHKKAAAIKKDPAINAGFMNAEKTMTEPQKTTINGHDRQAKTNEGIISQERIGSGEVMKMLCITKATLKSYRDNGIVPFDRPNPKGKITYLRSDVEQVLQTKKTKNRQRKNL
jgi:hypothetical protein